ncbi:unnamed protein product [Symbiodinium natans]|uniref:2'-phosphotransferase n=1 Tax=Symbiodinium natans TaxID=878477 RepID=A0A812TGX1_9DINO|nr:unnamed protein product [Symbiodinium natans]
MASATRVGLLAAVLLLLRPREEAWTTVRRATQQASPPSGRVAIVTGASTGLGLATAQALATSGDFSLIILAGRSQEKHEKALDSLRHLVPPEAAELRYMPLELDSLASVRDFAASFLALEVPLHCLVLNAGVMALPSRQVTSDGHEYQLAVNYLGHFLLANLLLDRMAAAASPRDPGRIISLSSSAHLIPSPLQTGDLSDLQSAKKYTPWQAYGQAKLCNLLFAYELDRRCRIGGIPIASNAIHPGAVATELKRHLPQNQEEEKEGPLEGAYQAVKSVVQPLLDLIVKSPEEGARTTVLLATSDQGKLSGHYWQDGRPSASLDTEVQGLLPAPLRALRIVSRLFQALAPAEKAATSYDTETWQELWKASERLVDLSGSEKPSAFSGPEPGVVEAPAIKSPNTLKDLKETAARALGFVHPESGNVWKPRHLFADTPSGNLREVDGANVPTDQVLWAEPPWAAGSVMTSGLTSHRQWGWRPWIWHRLGRLPCCAETWLPCFAAPLLCFRRRGATAAKGGRGSQRRDSPKARRKAARPSHFVALRVGEEAQQRAAKLQQELVSKAHGQVQQGLQRCLVPAHKLHVTMIALTLRSDQDIEAAKVALANVAADFAKEFSGPLRFRLSGLDSEADKVLFAKVQSEDDALGFLRRRLLERLGAESEGPAPVSEVPCGEPEAPENEQEPEPAASNEKLSRYLTRVLRHDAVRLGLALRSDGSVGLEELLALPFFKSGNLTQKDVEAEVRCNNKQRFQLWTENGARRIRANQGHKMKQVLDSELLQPILNAEDLPVCIHGTYFTKWSPKKKCQVQVWNQIKKEGLKPMGRNHIHFVPHEVGSRTVISGMREDCSVAIYLDVPKTIEKGIKLYRSANDVILSRGDDSGTIPPALFQRVVEIKSGRRLWPVEEPYADHTDSEVSVVAEEGLSAASARPAFRSLSGEMEGSTRQDAPNMLAESPLVFLLLLASFCSTDGTVQGFRDADLGLVVTHSLELCRKKSDEAGSSKAQDADTKDQMRRSKHPTKLAEPVQYSAGRRFKLSEWSTKLAGSLPGLSTVRELKAKLGGIEEQRLLLRTRALEDSEILLGLASPDEALRLVCVRTLRRLACSAGRDQRLRLWDLDRGQADRDLVGHTSGVLCVSVHWPSQRALSGSADRALLLWRLSGECIREMRGHMDSVQCLSVHWETNIALSASLDQTLLLWDLETGEAMQELMDYASPAISLDVDWVGRQALAGAMDGSLQLWDLRSAAAERRHRHRTALRFLQANWINLQAVSGDPHGCIVLWDLSPFEALRTCCSDGLLPAACMSVNPDMLEVAVGGIDGTLCLWSCCREAQEPNKAIKAHRSPLRVLAVDWAGRSALTSSDDDFALFFWNLVLGHCLRVLRGHSDVVSCLAVNWPSAVAISAAADCTLRLWDIGRGLCLRCLPESSRVLEVDWEQQRVLLSAGDPVLRLRDVFRRGVCVRELPAGQGNTVLCMAVDWATMRALTGDDDGQLTMWDLRTSQVLRDFHCHGRAIYCVQADWDGGRCLSGSDRNLLLWNLHSGQVLRQLTSHIGRIYCLDAAWSTQRVLTGGDDRVLRLWDLSQVSSLILLEGHTAAICSVDLSWQKQQAASASEDVTVRMWCLAQRCCTQVLVPDATVRCLEVDWSSSQLLAGSVDGLLRLWHINSEDYVQEFEGHLKGVTCVGVDWGSGLAISGSEDNSLRIWDLEAEDDSSDSTLFQVSGVLCVAMGCGPAVTPQGLT